VSFWDSCRFANWLGNGQGEGDTETGAYTLTTNGIANNTITRNAGATWAVASENEWYKAAYYKGGSANAGYWLYPTSSDTAPGRDMTDASGNNANYYNNGNLIGSPYYRTEVGEFQNSDSPFGTFDQGGNVWEYNETIIGGGASRSLRGGSFGGSDYGGVTLQSAYRNYYTIPASEDAGLGFRVSQVPEPSSFIALAALVTPLLVRGRSRKSQV
jgi:formylglycine-generating enzyme